MKEEYAFVKGMEMHHFDRQGFAKYGFTRSN